MATLVKTAGDKKPEIMTILMDEYGTYTYAAINVNIVETNMGYAWDALVLPEFALNNIHEADSDLKKSVLISHIIKAYYNDNQMSAILNNYLVDMEDEDYKAEFLEMQKIRKIAKDTAKHIVNYNIF